MSRLRTAIGWRLAGLVLASVVQAITYIYLARAMGPSDYGVFAAMFAAGGLCYSVFGFGFTPLALRTLPGAEGDRTRALIVSIRFVVAALIAALFVVIGTALETPHRVISLAIAFVVVDAITDVSQAALAGMRKVKNATVMLICQRAGVLAAVLIAFEWNQLWAVFVIALLITLANVASTVRLLPRWREASRLITRSRGYWAANLAAAVGQIEYPVIAFFGGAHVAGVYGASSRAAGPVTLAAQALLQVTTPELTAASPQARSALFLRLRRATFLVLACAVVGALPAGVAVAWVLGPGFEPAWAVAAGFVVGSALMAINQVHQAILLAAQRPAQSAFAVALGATAGVIVAGLIATTGRIEWLGLVPVLAQGIMLLRFRSAVKDLI